VAVKSIRARFGDLIDDSAGGAAVLRVVIVGEDLEFLDRVRIGTHDNVVAEKVGVIAAVQKKREGLGALSADGERIARAVVGIRGEHARLQQSQLQGIAIEQRQVIDHAFVFDFSEDGAGGVHLDDVGGNLDGLRFLADFQRHVQVAVLIQLEDDAVLDEGFKAGLIYRQTVPADLDQVEQV